MKKENLKKLNNSLSKFAQASAKRAFLVFLVLVLIAVLVGGFLFYKYNILTQKVEPEITEKPVQFKENLYQKILAEWQNREERFEQADAKECPDPFR